MISFLTRQAAIDGWGQLSELFDQALAHDPFGLTTDALREGVEADRVAVAVAHEGQQVFMAAAFRFAARDEGPYLVLLALAGQDVRKWLIDLVEAAEKVAAQAECVGLMFQGRPGWRKLVKEHGYDTAAVVMRKRLT